jgi:hypothetical protein
MARNEAVTKALLSIADGKVGMGENLGTLGQTARMLSSPLKALAGGLRSVWKNDSLRPLIRESKRSLERKNIQNHAADLYLQYVYGWKPLVQDIHGICELMKEEGVKPLLIHGRGVAKREIANSSHTEDLASYNSKTTVKDWHTSSKVSCNLWAEIDPDWQGARALNQLGLANPLALAWELSSWSFVVDWVLPIGPVLNALTAPAGLKFVDGSISNRVSGTGSYDHHYDAIDSYANGQKATGTISYEGYNRERIGAWPLPGLWIDPDPLRGDRPLKALALMVSDLRNLR